MNQDDEKVLRLKIRSRKTDDGRTFSNALRKVHNALRKNGISLSGKRGTTRHQTKSFSFKPTLQRCAVRLSFATNKANGQWQAHGRYIAREGAQSEQERGQGLSQSGRVDVAGTLGRWQNSNDPRMFKLILSPEFGDQMNLEQFTQEFMQKLEKDLGVPLEWVAVDHYNTDHPHVHVALRGIDKNRQELRLDKGYIKNTIRVRGQEAATNQLGVRTELQQLHALDRETKQSRFTSLDRSLLRRATSTPDGWVVDFKNGIPSEDYKKQSRLREIRRLTHLDTMGLAHKIDQMTWVVSGDFEKVLREMQQSGDVLKTLYSTKDMRSDTRMPIQRTSLSAGESIEGRLIGTGEDELTNKTYLLLETGAGIVHHIYQNQSAQKARHDGSLRRGDYILIESKGFDKEGQRVEYLAFKNYGAGAKLLTNSEHLSSQVMRSVTEKNVLPSSRVTIGWLGQYAAALDKQAGEMLKQGVLKKTITGYELIKRKQVDVSKAIKR